MYFIMPLWTPEQAAFFARKGAADRKARLKRIADREAVLDKLIAQAGEKAAEAIAERTNTDDSYATQQVVIVRDQLARLHQKLRESEDSMDSFRLASAITKLGEYEAALANRPGPGSLRPTAARAPRSTFVPPADA
jgi:hypothetical protein